METYINNTPWNFQEMEALKKSNLAKAPKPHTFEKNGKLWETTTCACDRCFGTGRFPSLNYNGICLKCNGSGLETSTHRVLSDKEKAQRERAKARKAAKKAKELEAHHQAWLEEQEKEKAEEEAKAKAKAEELAKLNWIGEEGQKVELTLKLILCKPFESLYGVKLFHLMEDPNGNKVIYSGMSSLFPEGEDTITRTFKIKAHQESEQYGKSTKVSLR